MSGHHKRHAIAYLLSILIFKILFYSELTCGVDHSLPDIDVLAVPAPPSIIHDGKNVMTRLDAKHRSKLDKSTLIAPTGSMQVRTPLHRKCAGRLKRGWHRESNATGKANQSISP